MRARSFSRSFPVAERIEELLAEAEVGLGAVRLAGELDRRPHLVEVIPAEAAPDEVALEVDPVARRERALEVVGHELDELVAGDIGLFRRRQDQSSSMYRSSAARSF